MLWFAVSTSCLFCILKKYCLINKRVIHTKVIPCISWDIFFLRTLGFMCNRFVCIRLGPCYHHLLIHLSLIVFIESLNRIVE